MRELETTNAPKFRRHTHENFEDLDFLDEERVKRKSSDESSNPTLEMPSVKQVELNTVVVCVEGNETPYPLVKNHRITIGRGGSCEISLDKDDVSRLHGVLRCDDDVWCYVDLGSTNGSFFVRETSDGEEVHERISSNRKLHLSTNTELRIAKRVKLHFLEDRFAFEDPDDATLRSDAAKEFEEELVRAAEFGLPVALLGPSGSGKTWAAKRIHRKKSDKNEAAVGEFVNQNSAHLSTDINQLKSTLFGHVKGAFTGADSAKMGLLEQADGGTLFLDEIESISVEAQGILLDVLEEKTFYPYGASQKKSNQKRVEFQLVVASKVPLLQTSLRGDLVERLILGIGIEVPHLEDRREDIPGLVRGELARLKAQNVHVLLSDDAMAFCVNTPWRGQVRQLLSTVHSTAVQVASKKNGMATISKETLQKVYEKNLRVVGPPRSPGRDATHRDIPLTQLPVDVLPYYEAHENERYDKDDEPTNLHNKVLTSEEVAAEKAKVPKKRNARVLTSADVLQALDAADFNLTHAARSLGIARNTFLSKMDKFGIPRRK